MPTKIIDARARINELVLRLQSESNTVKGEVFEALVEIRDLLQAGRAKVRVTYTGDTFIIEYNVEEVEVEMVEEEPDLFMTYKGVPVYHTTSDQGVVSEYWFALTLGRQDDHDQAFDVRDLPAVAQPSKFDSLFQDSYDKQAIANALELGILAANV